MKYITKSLLSKLGKNEKRDYAVIGLGRFGSAVCETLHDLGYGVLAADKDEKKVSQILLEKKASHAVQLDITEVSALKSAGLMEFETVIVALGNYVEESIIVTMSLKEAGVKQVIAKASSDIHMSLLKKVGADMVVFPEREMGCELARILTKPKVLDWLELDEKHSIVEVVVPEKFVDKTLADLQLRNEYGINVLAIHRNEAFDVNPSPQFRLQQGDNMVVIGSNEGIEKIS